VHAEEAASFSSSREILRSLNGERRDGFIFMSIRRFNNHTVFLFDKHELLTLVPAVACARARSYFKAFQSLHPILHPIKRSLAQRAHASIFQPWRNISELDDEVIIVLQTSKKQHASVRFILFPIMY